MTVLIYGKLSDVYGRSPLYIFGLVVFAVGSVLCGLARAAGDRRRFDDEHAAGNGRRHLQPTGAGAGWGLSSILGPAIGGWITDAFSWRWVFYITLPMSVLVIIGVLYSLPKVRASEQVKIDWLVPMLLALSLAGTEYAWNSPVVLILFGGGAVVSALFFWYERRGSDPVIAPALFRNRIFTVSLVLRQRDVYAPVYAGGDRLECPGRLGH